MLQSILIGRFVNSLQRDVFSQFVLRSFYIELVPFPDVSNHRQTDFSKEPLCSVFLAQGHNIIESDLILNYSDLNYTAVKHCFATRIGTQSLT